MEKYLEALREIEFRCHNRRILTDADTIRTCGNLAREALAGSGTGPDACWHDGTHQWRYLPAFSRVHETCASCGMVRNHLTHEMTRAPLFWPKKEVANGNA